MQIEPLSHALGARIRGIDLRQDLTPEIVARISELWLEHLVLCFPDQHLDKFQFTAFAACFGELELRSKLNQDQEVASVGYVRRGPNGYKSGTEWHTDDSYTVRPTSASFLLAKEVPAVGGDTMFANQYLAYETLTPRIRAFVDTLRILQAVPYRGVAPDPNELPAVQPAVRVHPGTGRKSLFLGSHASRVIGMTPTESKIILDFLNAHAVRYEFTYRHAWSLNDLVMWDNRPLLHIALRDYDEKNEPRTMLRACCIGEPSGALYNGSDVDYENLALA